MNQVAAKRGRTYTTQFWLLCTSSLLFFASFNMIIPELPAWLTRLGGGDYKGLIIGLFTLTAMASRPFSGKLADKLGRIPVMIFGAVVCFVCSLLYPILTTVAGFLFLRLVHGFSTGFTPTGATAYISDIVPANRRGEAMGIVGTAGSVGTAAGPAIGGSLANHFSVDFVFYCSAFFAISSILIVSGIKETVGHKNKFRASMLRIRRHEIFERRVWIPCLIMALSVYAYGTVYTLIPDFGEYTGIRNKGLLFTFLTVASLAVRLMAGKASDRYGRKSVLKISTLIIVAGMLTLGFSTSPHHLIIGVTLYGMGQGMTSPTLLAWAADLSDQNNRGKGISSLYIFMEFGIFCGSIASGFIYGNDANNFLVTFLISGVLSSIAFVFLFILKPAHTGI